jgi:hypothetical protein
MRQAPHRQPKIARRGSAKKKILVTLREVRIAAELTAIAPALHHHQPHRNSTPASAFVGLILSVCFAPKSVIDTGPATHPKQTQRVVPNGPAR